MTGPDPSLARIAELEAALGVALEIIERMEAYYFADPMTTERQREDVRSIQQWITALVPSVMTPSHH